MFIFVTAFKIITEITFIYTFKIAFIVYNIIFLYIININYSFTFFSLTFKSPLVINFTNIINFVIIFSVAAFILSFNTINFIPPM
ncbi:hypothetical protein GLOIN_2v1500373 [Rhizophagus irregularis DAOM 181602=DAOM 197198]|uniref:Uncharacterized protein n=1 Tax=Rhizophagus irregularis (strain DAOM 181602 / DAOM 197198 / MUCL 43194) TaxID=747089 RepID=A0A2P4QX73_RHIID|nr:hypothetical protein GLOIN_2v1500373 [Rhizophagus irregularis DAOM 181602=DAOM 197198]POG82253.1 hypothetical protein GLOIN_2v1500373 [Rhizophagus irregularis DAOM 181602=DAOM 197198]|eukprot:XP_025189119.1 hypothetical protein GLOIN_2v1500373 [Rhizophagus irregularis DAOM 181602=DAOM 197198]